MRALAERSADRGVDVQTALLWYRTGKDAPPASALAERLGLATLRQEMSTGDSLEAPAARRMLYRIAALVSFYEPRAYLARGDFARAARMLEVAASIAPLRGEACDQMAELRRRAPTELPRPLVRENGQLPARVEQRGIRVAVAVEVGPNEVAQGVHTLERALLGEGAVTVVS